tara:strand:+ start:266 stop:469 length:204 start_codon:yes stop_codon:yes gene_type:complete
MSVLYAFFDPQKITHIRGYKGALEEGVGGRGSRVSLVSWSSLITDRRVDEKRKGVVVSCEVSWRREQ